MKNLAFRTISGIIYVCVIIFGLTYHKYSFLLLFAFLSSMMILELSKGLNSLSGIKISNFGLIVFNLIIFLTLFLSSNLNSNSYLFLGIIPILALPILELFRRNENPILNCGLSFFVLIYIGLPFALSNKLYFSLQNLLPET